MKLITANLHDFALRYVTVSSEPVAYEKWLCLATHGQVQKKPAPCGAY